MYELIIILILLLFNGALAMSEIAFVSSKRFKLEEMAKRGNQSAKKALLLLNEPERFLSAVQIGITLIGIFAGAFGGYAMAENLTHVFQKIDFIKEYSFEISFAIIVAFITYLSLIIGELLPKTIALNQPEKITILMAPAMYYVTKIFSPFVSLLSYSTKLLLFLLRIKKNDEPPVTEEELKSLLELGTKHGTFEIEESEMIKKIFNFADKKVNSILIPRTEIKWIDLSKPNGEIFKFISTNNFSRYFVCENNLDNVKGYIESKEFLIRYNEHKGFDFRSIINELIIVPESIYSLELLEKFRERKTNIALIVDEYGGTQGLITLHDLIENIFGDLPEKYEEHNNEIVRRKDGSFLVNGSADIIKISDYFSIEFDSNDYTTINGFIMSELGRIPSEGDLIIYNSYEFEIIDMDGKVVDKILVKKITSK